MYIHGYMQELRLRESLPPMAQIDVSFSDMRDQGLCFLVDALLEMKTGLLVLKAAKANLTEKSGEPFGHLATVFVGRSAPAIEQPSSKISRRIESAREACLLSDPLEPVFSIAISSSRTKSIRNVRYRLRIKSLTAFCSSYSLSCGILHQ